MTKYLVIVFYFLISIHEAAAGLVQTDWKVAGDGQLTYVEELNIEILDVTNTHISHVEASNELGIGGAFEGFRFMHSNEMLSIMEMMVDDIWGTPSLDEQENVKFFLNLIGEDESGSVGLNTCDHAYGCELYDTPTPALVDGHRHILMPHFLIWRNDPFDFNTQMLVRDVHVSEPASILLLFLCLGFFQIQRRLSRS